MHIFRYSIYRIFLLPCFNYSDTIHCSVNLRVSKGDNGRLLCDTVQIMYLTGYFRTNFIGKMV